MPTTNIKVGTELSASELHGMLRLRGEVFVVEQGIIYVDIDGQDLTTSTTHFWIAEDDRIASCLRVVPEGDGSRVGRVCTRRSHRRLGYGLSLLRLAVQKHGGASLVLDGQSAVANFYEAAGFVATGPEFLDDGIPHIPMRWSASSAR